MGSLWVLMPDALAWRESPGMSGAAGQDHLEGGLTGEPVNAVWQDSFPVMGAAWQDCLDCRLACSSVDKAKSLTESNVAGPQAPLWGSRGAVSAWKEALARSLGRPWSMMGSLLCIDDLVAQVPQPWDAALQLMLVLLRLAGMTRIGLHARQADWSGGLWTPVLAAVGRTRAALSAYLRRVELPAPMAAHSVTLLGSCPLALGLDPLAANLNPAAGSVIWQRGHAREQSAG